MADLDEEDDNIIQEKELGRYTIHYSDLKNRDLELKIVRLANDSICNGYDKEIASRWKELLDKEPELNKPSCPKIGSLTNPVEEHGVWQTIVGRQFVASVTFDAELLLYFKFDDLNKFFLCFRS